MQTFPDMLQIFVTYLYDTLDPPSCQLQTPCELSRTSSLYATVITRPSAGYCLPDWASRP